MATLRKAIEDRIALLTREIAAIRESTEAIVKDLQNDIYAEQKKLESFGPWLEQDIADAKVAVNYIFAVYEERAKKY